MEQTLAPERPEARPPTARVLPPPGAPRAAGAAVAPPSGGRRHERAGGAAAHFATRWPLYLAGGVAVLYVLVFVRGFAWQWDGILTASRVSPPVAGVAQPPPASRQSVPVAGNPAAQAAPRGADSPPAAAPKVPLAPTDEPAPRNTVDKYGVTYDAQGVAVLGIDADTGGAYNVPPGRQVRIGGPQGQLFDVGPGGKLTPATAVRGTP